VRFVTAIRTRARSAAGRRRISSMTSATLISPAKSRSPSAPSIPRSGPRALPQISFPTPAPSPPEAAATGRDQHATPPPPFFAHFRFFRPPHLAAPKPFRPDTTALCRKERKESKDPEPPKHHPPHRPFFALFRFFRPPQLAAANPLSASRASPGLECGGLHDRMDQRVHPVLTPLQHLGRALDAPRVRGSD
jgi:hypothetical protein